MTPDPDKDPSVAALVAGITQDVQTLVRGEIELAKAEASVTAKRFGLGAGMFAGALALILFAVLLFAFSLSFGIVEAFDWPVWTGFAIVGVLLLLIAGLLVAIGAHAMKKLKGLERTKDEAVKTKSALADRQGLGVATGLVGPETLGLEEEAPRHAVS